MKKETLSPLVSVYCMTYNHKDTIAQTIESILNQQTDFDFELIIHDDASNDGTSEIVRQYAEKFPDRIVPIIQKQNQFYNCNIAKTYLNPAAKGKYVAICEGDDFFTDTKKLQRQVDFLEQNDDCSLIFHSVSQIMPNGEKLVVRPLKKSGYVSADTIIARGGLFCPSVSIMVKSEVMQFFPEFRSMADVYDYPLQILAATKGKVYYLDENMAAYRFAGEGSWTAQRENSADIEHLENERAWLSVFNEYSKGEYEEAINFHLAHLYFTQWRKTFDKNLKKETKILIKKLPLLKRMAFTILMFAFSVLGKGANKLFSQIKKLLLK